MLEMLTGEQLPRICQDSVIFIAWEFQCMVENEAEASLSMKKFNIFRLE